MKVSFVSYKGGVGRTSTLINAAIMMSQVKGNRIGMIDLDIEAPSLHCLFGIDIEPSQSILYVLHHRSSFVTDDKIFRIRDYINDKNDKLGKGECFLLPCYPDIDLVNAHIDDGEIIDNFGLIIDNFISSKGLDHVFIDCRSGFSVYAGVANYNTDKVVIVFRLDEQNLLGISKIIQYYKTCRMPITLVASNVPDLPEADLYKNKFEEVIGQPIDVLIRLEEELLFGKHIASLRYTNNHHVNKQYRKLIDKIINS